MDALFANKFKHTKSNHIEAYKSIYPLFRSAFYIILALIYFALAIFIYYRFYDIIPSVIIAAFGIFLAVYPTIRLNILANKQQKQFLTLYNEIPEATTCFYDDNIKSTSLSDKSEITIDYNKIIKLKQTKNLYLLIMKEKLSIIVDKNNFEKGTCEEFEKFIVSKATNAKNKL